MNTIITKSKISVNSSLDVSLLSDEYARQGNIHIENILAKQSAERIHRSLSEQAVWNVVWNNNGEHVDMNSQDLENWSAEQNDKLREIIISQAKSQFQYYYESIPIYDIYKNGSLPGHFFNHLYEFVNGEEFLSLARSVTSREDIKFADIQATRYSAGHFLKEHDDNVAGKNRIAAYVLNLTPNWEQHWGGALVFNDEHPKSVALFPSFNALNIFSVPRKHSVSIVSPYANAKRYSITGWLRA